MVAAVHHYQDKETSLWYQVVGQGNRGGNYLEASASCMFVYAMATGVNKGYLPKKYKKIAEKSYQGIIEHLISIEEGGMLI